MNRIAVVLFNLGGPDGPDAVEPFLFNLFNDPAIIGAPGLVRWSLAKFISMRRAPFAREIYAHIGGKSPLLNLTNDQARALDGVMASRLENVEVRSFVSMRYWHPFSDAVARDVKAFAPDRIVLLPLYPQFSTTTTGSSFDDWDRVAERVGLSVETKRICCYPTEPGFIAAQAQLLRDALAEAQKGSQRVRVLFSAHGLPKKIVEGKHDPYPDHVALGAQAIVDALTLQGITIDDWNVSYQSRVGPLEWIGPNTEDEIKRAADDDRALVVVPIAFVSEHSETLVELDIEYKELALENGVSSYIRVPTVGTEKDYIDCLHGLVLDSLNQGDQIHRASKRACGVSDYNCPNARK